MNKDLISVMVPCYNTEKYLAKCIESIINQTYTNIELILLNDGSNDNSLKIMQEYATKDNRITIINRDNKGISFSRNELIAKAKGKYLAFIDSDDTVSPVYCEKLLNALLETGADVSICHISNLHDGEIPHPNSMYGRQVYNKYETIDNLISKADCFELPTAKLFTRKALTNIEYPVNRIYEDTATAYKIYCNIDKSVVIFDELYYYLVKREGSITGKNYSYKNLNDNYLVITEKHDFLSQNVKELADVIDLGYIRNILTLFDRVYLSNNDELINSEIVSKLYKDLKETYALVANSSNYNRLMNNYKRCCLYFLLNDRITDYVDMIRFVNTKRS